MCLVNDIENFDATKNFVDLHVGMEAAVEVREREGLKRQCDKNFEVEGG
jgi:hypothetical protein